MGLLAERVALPTGLVTTSSIVMAGVEMRTSCVSTHPDQDPLARPCLKTTNRVVSCLSVHK